MPGIPHSATTPCITCETNSNLQVSLLQIGTSLFLESSGTSELGSAGDGVFTHWRALPMQGSVRAYNGAGSQLRQNDIDG